MWVLWGKLDFADEKLPLPDYFDCVAKPFGQAVQPMAPGESEGNGDFNPKPSQASPKGWAFKSLLAKI